MTVTVAVTGPTRVGQARREAVALARELGFPAAAGERLAIVVTELATNILRHATAGFVVAQALPGPGAPGLEVVAVDAGPGIPDVGRSLEDGYSTVQGLGGGLGAVRRLSDELVIDSWPGHGTIVVVRAWPSPAARAGPAPRVVAGGLVLPAPGESVSGDAWAYAAGPKHAALILADGLGHGPSAAEASAAALRAFEEDAGAAAPGELLASVDHALHRTRGAAVAIARLEPAEGVVRFAGLGNVEAAICAGRTVTRLASRFGVAGHEGGPIREQAYPWKPGAAVVMHSDGLSSHWTADDLGDPDRVHPTVLAARLVRARRRGADDAAAAVLRAAPPEAR